MPLSPLVYSRPRSQVHTHDENVLSVLTYAVAHLGVEHVVVVGHPNSGGVAASLAASSKPTTSAPSSPLERWLEPLTTLAKTMDHPSSAQLVEANVRAQVQHVLESEVITAAWSKDPAVRGEAKLVGVHGWVYELESGRVRAVGFSPILD